MNDYSMAPSMLALTPEGATTLTIIILLLPFAFITIFRFVKDTLLPQATKASPTNGPENVIQPHLLQELRSALPDPESIIFPTDGKNFRKYSDVYWAQQENEVLMACIVRPGNAVEVGKVIKALGHEFEQSRSSKTAAGSPQDTATIKPLFAIRGGAHSPLPSAASCSGGIIIDLSLLNTVSVSPDQTTVSVGGGAKWGDVSTILDKHGLAVSGGRNSAVGVGGLTLGGGISFFTPRYGFVCSNVVSYKVVLASGEIVTASERENEELWWSLKGGLNNFGIVTTFVFPTVKCGKVWSGFLYLPSWQTQKVLGAFHKSVDRAAAAAGGDDDDAAAGPIACFSYVYAPGMKVISVNLVHTNPSTRDKTWPKYWKASNFPNIWRFWSTCRLRTLTDTTNELSSLNPSGRRQVFGTTTIKNDYDTIVAAYAAFEEGITKMKQRGKVNGLVFTLVLQPLIPRWLRKGQLNPVIWKSEGNEALVMVSFTVNWNEKQDDRFVKGTTQWTLQRIEEVAKERGTAHPWRYMNYCSEWQNPYEGYDKNDLEELKATRRKYDPKGLFQHGCTGTFKLER